ncbi:YjbH domain-containing protein [Pseudomonas sp. CCI3.1]|uniref:YjbH domain-containing protein n=1 Tax=Pseudomonas sp. CCI3.1 TaxID=3048618 RepID=UPI002AB549F5|nr:MULTISPECIES: YjbH domain-containing protein [unclassified Pseudomonas]MDY7584987.1 YjbH domain-containing protein [Pseudomonas sp. CCI3.1]MEB0066294.1 YjbH domain-containing protein [Pseudomonas sp. CCI3.1]MEB0071612.1 YjbH domain-containing protein [Pseudomonas sp. CCI1.4]
MKLRFAVVVLLPYSLAHAEPRYTQNDFGGVGLLQTPTARMAPAGELSLNANRTEPYSRYSLSLQPLDWLEGTFRYTSITNRMYGSEALSGNQSYKDKAIDVKARLWQESHWLPEVALGFRDIGGTGLFSSEYFVANKRYKDLDFSLGIAWGYIGNRGDMDNPLGYLDNSFDTRPTDTTVGDVNTNTYFRGSPALFGGVVYQTPWAPLSLKVEFDGNDYKHEPQNNNQVQDSPINIGAVYKLNENIDLTAGWERGNTALFGITLHTNFVSRKAPAKTYDPPAQPLPTHTPTVGLDQVDWAEVSKKLESNAGYKVERIAQRDSELMVYGEQSKYFYAAKGAGRASRILDNSANDEIQWFTLVNKRYDMPVEETSVPRSTFRNVVNNEQDLVDLHRTTEVNRATAHYDKTLYQQKPDPFTYGFGLGYQQNLGGPDGFLLYQISAYAEGQYRFTPSTWASGGISANLLNNYDKFKYDSASNLPRVRTDLRQYVTTSDVTMPALQLNKAKRLDQDLYGMVYGGYLESMYAGVGGELLYRPMGERWSIGADLNYVRQRDFDQGFGLRDYKTVTGHITTYTKLPFDLVAAVSVGRYLARDWGTTIDISREFTNGVKFGGWVTRTTASKEEYGEGSFDKGIYISIPFDEMMSVSTMSRANIAWAPLTRDGGAMLHRQYSLHTMTDGRNRDAFYENFEKITE